MRKAVVILPTFNEKESIKNLIEKIFRQQKNLPKWTLEVLVVDSQSPDGTGKIVKSLQKTYKEKLIFWKPKKKVWEKPILEALPMLWKISSLMLF
jgi:dolichol-phosphate mannosyltransferase